MKAQEERLLDGLEAVLAEAGEKLTALRRSYFERLAPAFGAALADERPELREIELVLQEGWRGESLRAALQRSRQRDLEQGVTQTGPHRAEVAMVRDGQAVRSLLSRGEQKAVAASLLLTQARLLAEGGEHPLFLLDDLASELDGVHVERVMAGARRWAAQVWVTGVAPMPVSGDHRRFHVEHGRVAEVV